MRAPHLIASFARWVAISLIFVSGGCGGGTTGTSPTGGFEFVGLVRSSTGTPVSDTDMTVSSADGTAELATARTNAKGIFSMELPPAVSSLVATVGDKRSQPISRVLPGSGILSTQLVETDAGEFVGRFSFEVKVDQTLLCSAFRSEGNVLYRREELGRGTDCLIPFLVASPSLVNSRFRATIVSNCGLTEVEQDSFRPNSQGKIVVDVGPLLDAGCSAFSIVVTHDDAPQPGARFTIFG